MAQIAAAWLTAIALMTPQTSTLPNFMTQYSADLGALNRLHTFSESPTRHTALLDYYSQAEKDLAAIPFNQLSPADRADWLLMQLELDEKRQEVQLSQTRLAEIQPLIPFLTELSKFHDHRISRTLPQPEQFAAELAQLERAVTQATQSISNEETRPQFQDFHGQRAVAATNSARRALNNWYDHFAGYDPLFTWWCKKPVQQVDAALEKHRAVLTEIYVKPAEDKITGDPVGREELVRALRREMIDYTPEELITIAENELKWVDKEFAKAAQDLGYGDNWRAALEHVKTLHEKPGDQPKLIRELADEAIDYLEKHNLLTIPPLAKEVWRMDMMSPERQKVSPFFLGGETIIISFPTDEMTHEEKLMSLRSNNRYFAKATVHHELIPGHHMQFYMTSRHNTHRNGVTGTPFWIEGWALYWEFLLYQRKFAATPEERVGFLFWRKHRCARIIFSLKYHLGQMTTDECVKMLTDVVGHEQSTAEGEVRRSFNGTYPPLYQAAYMLGALQLWEIRRELVLTGKIPEKEFHDQIMQLGNMPWAVIRKLLGKEPIPQKLEPWKFYRGNIED